jgi:transglutaminase-like putative cysteine protease
VKRILQTALFLAVIITLQVGAVAHAQQEPAEAFHFETELTITNSGETVMRYARVFMPLITPMTHYGEIISETYSQQPEDITATENGQRTAAFYLEDLAPGQRVQLTISYEIASPSELPSMADHTACDNSGTQAPEIVATARRLTGHLNTGEERIAALIHFTHQHITYDKDSPWRHGDALTALHQAEGVCEDYASLLVALARAAGIESRIVYGYRRSPRSGAWERHAWTEYRLEDEDWKPADPTIHSGPGLNESAVYIAQWYEDEPTRIRFSGGKPAASLKENIAEIR